MTLEAAHERVAESEVHDDFARIRRVLELSADIAQLMAQTQAEIVRQNSETLQDVMRTVSTSSRRCCQSADPFAVTRAAHAAGTTIDRSPFSKVGSVAQTILQSDELIHAVSTEWLQFARRRADRNLHYLERFVACQTPKELAAVEYTFARDNLQSVLRCMRQMAELSIRKTDEAARKTAPIVEKGKAD